MKRMLYNHRKYLLFVSIIFIISFIIGIIYYYFLDNPSKLKVITLVKDYNFQINNIFKDLLIMTIVLITSFFIIGLPISILYISYESFIFGFVINSFILSFKIKSILYIAIYLLFRIIPFILIIIFTYKILNITRYRIGYLIYKEKLIKDKIYQNFIKNVYIIIFVLIINIIVYFVSHQLTILQMI